MKRYGEKPIQLGPGVTVHPHIHSGAPCVSGRRIATSLVEQRFLAGESVASIAEDYAMDSAAVENALRYELRRRTQRKPEYTAECTCREGKNEPG